MAASPVLAAIDGSRQGRAAASAAADLARRWQAPLHVVHACSLPVVSWDAGATQAALDSLRAISEDILAEQLRALERAGFDDVKGHLAIGGALNALLDAAAKLRPQLVAVGSRGLGGVDRLLLGSVSEGLVHNSRWPVLVVRGGPRAWPPAMVLAGDDGSADAAAATDLAARFASTYGVPLQLLTAFSPRLSLSPVGVRTLRDARGSAEARLLERGRELAARSGARVKTSAVVGDAAQALVEAAGSPSAGRVIVVGSRGLGAIQRMRLGSTSTKVLRAASGSVLVVPRHR